MTSLSNSFRSGWLRRMPARLTAMAAWASVLLFAAAPARAAVDFNRDIRPILSDNCYTCHGPDAEHRKAGLRLDEQGGAFAQLKSGDFAIVPGQPEQSTLVERILADDDDQMPPEKSGKKLTPEQIELLQRWITDGAEWKPHWSFISPVRPAAPAVKNQRQARNPIDQFVRARLEQEQLKSAPEADKATLIRRVTFDLTGLPPTPAEVDAFLADRKPGAYERLVDRLLQSPRYGEHEARYWLDLARYGDTHGLHLDNERSMWPYRDWVVSAFNRNLPFDQFTVEQLAGDLLPDATDEQKVASGFNRCNVSTSEGGAIDEEFYVRYAVDRVETAGVAWMGLTLACAACHDHKFDPISQKEFYELFAFFNSMNEKAMDGNALLPPPMMKLPTPEQKARFAQLNESIAPIEALMRAEAAKIDYKEPKGKTAAASERGDFVWVEDDFPADAKVQHAGDPLEWIEGDQVFSGKRALARTGEGVVQDYFTGARQPLIVGNGDILFAHVYLDPTNLTAAIMLQFHVGGWSHRANWGDEDAIPFGEKGTVQKLLLGPLPKAGEWVRLEVEARSLGLTPGTQIDGIAFTQHGGKVHWDQAGINTATPQEDRTGVSLLAWERHEAAKKESDIPRDVREAIQLKAYRRDPEHAQLIRDYYIANVYAETRPIFEPYIKQIADIRKERDDLEKQFPATMISQEMEKPREAFVLIRGEYDQPGKPVQRAVPAVLPPLPPSDTTNRLDFARWLVSPKHPLTARVTINRFWQQFFGTGLVKTSGDFGAQGEWPSHPELLDWLATKFVDSGWNVKHMIRLMVTSATYRQDSVVTPALHQRDPENRLLARGPRFRLDAEMIRDNALYVSGLLVEQMGGRGVRPYQPPGIWEAVGYTTSNTAKFERDQGDALYRRSLYIFWKRTAPPPYLTTFDAPSREKFCTRRERTDTPLQALVTMNDPAFVEAARHLGARMIAQGRDPRDRLSHGFRLVTARRPSAAEMSVLRGALDKFQTKYQHDVESARKLLSVGESPVNEKLNPSEFAAYTMVASLLLNLDETLNKN